MSNNESSIRSAPPTSAIVLAGGKSRRMGQDKRRLKLWGDTGPTLLEHTVQLVGQLCDETVVVLHDAEAWSQLPAHCVADLYHDAGPLAGIATGLSAISHERALVVACDMPLLNQALLNFLIYYPSKYDVLVPYSIPTDSTRNQRGLEPLHAIYSKACLPSMDAYLHAGQRQIAAFLETVRVVFVQPEEYQHLDPDGRSFLNVNSAAELAVFQKQKPHDF